MPAQVVLSPDTIMNGSKLVAGEIALDGANPTAIATGLKNIVAVFLTLKGSVAPGANTSVLSYTVSGGTVSVHAWKNTGLASTTTETIGYLIFGN
jgi:hypothetical protein